APAFLPSEVGGPRERILDGLAGSPLTQRGLLLPCGLLLLLPGGRDEQAQQRRDEHRRCRPPPGPPHRPFDRADGPGADRRPAEEPAEVAGQFPGTGVAAGGGLVEALQADRLQVPRYPRVEPRRRDRLLGDHLPLRLRGRLRPERRPTREYLVED